MAIGFVRSGQASPTCDAVGRCISVVGRHLFCNNSAFDDVTDGDAIAIDEVPRFDGPVASSDSYSSYVHGVNGLIVDCGSLNGEVDEDDFQFKVGNVDDADQWGAATAPSSITTEVRRQSWPKTMCSISGADPVPEIGTMWINDRIDFGGKCQN